MKKFEKLLEKRWLSNILTVCVGILLYMGISNFHIIAAFFDVLSRIMSPIVVGFVLAYLLDPIAIFFEQKFFGKKKTHKKDRFFSVMIVLLLLTTLIVLFFVALIPSLISCITGIFSNRAIYIKNVEEMIRELNRWNMGFHLDLSTLTNYLADGLFSLFDNLSANMDQIIKVSKNVGGALVNGLLGFILCIYFLTGKEHLINGINEFRFAAMGEEKFKAHNDFWLRCHKIFIQFLGYDLVDGLIVALVNAIVMGILGMPYIALISVIVGVTNLLPTFGPVIGLVVGGLLLFLSSPLYAFWFLIMVIIIQTIDGYILKPKLFGGALGIPPVWTLIAIVLGGKLFGWLGILLAIPFAAVINFLYLENFLPWLQKRRNEEESGDDK